MPRYLRHRRYMRHTRYDRHVQLTTIKSVGALQYSSNGTTWLDSIPAGTMKVNTQVDFYVRAKSVLPEDDGSYQYDFLMQEVGSGGLSLINGVGNIAHVSGKTPSDQVGLLFSVNVTVIDVKGNSVNGTALTQNWIA